MGYKKIKIAEPCQQEWNHMIPENGGRHCDSCKHTVVDFSELSDTALLTALETGTSHCGRFSAQQLDKMYYVVEAARERKKYWSAIGAAIVGGFLQLTTSYAQTTQNPARLQKVERYRLHLRTDGITTPSEEKETTDIREIKIRVLARNNHHPIAGVYISMDELGIQERTNDDGWLIVKTDVSKLDLDQKITIELHASYQYKDKTFVLTLADLLKKQKIIYLGKEKWSGKIMGAYAYG